MKLNINYVIYMVLCSIAIALCCVLSSLLLLIDYTALKYISLFVTFFIGIYLVKICHKYQLYK